MAPPPVTTTTLARLEHGVRTLLTHEATPLDEGVAQGARDELAGVAQDLRNGLTERREALTQDHVAAMSSGRALLGRIVSGRSAVGGDPQPLVEAMVGAMLVDSRATRVAPDGRVLLDARRLVDALPSTGDVTDGVAALRLGAAEGLAGGALGSDTTPAWKRAWNGRPLDRSSERTLQGVATRIEQARSGELVVPAGLDLGEGAPSRARAAIAQRLAEPLPGGAALRILPGDLDAAPGSLERLRGVAARLGRTSEALQSSSQWTRGDQLAADAPELRRLVASARDDLHELAASEHLDLVTGSVGSSLELEAAGRALAAAGTSVASGVALGYGALDDVGRAAVATFRGANEALGPDIAPHLALRATLARDLTAPAGDIDGLAAIAIGSLARVAREADHGASQFRKSQLGNDLARVLGRLDAGARSGAALREPDRLRIDALVTDLERRRMAGFQVQSSIPVRALLTPDVADLLRADRPAFAARIARIDALAAIEDPATQRAAVRSSLQDGLPIPMVTPLRRMTVVGAYQRVGHAAMSRSSAGRIATATATDPDRGLFLRASAHAPASIGWTRGATESLVSAVLGYRGPHVDDALRGLFDDGLVPADDQLVAQLGRLRAAAHGRVAHLPDGDRLRAHADEIDRIVAAFDGEAHQAPGIDRYVGELAGLVDRLDAAPAQLHAAFASRATDIALAELARGIEAMRTQRTEGRVARDELWPNRGALGTALTDSRLLADLHRISGQPGGSI